MSIIVKGNEDFGSKSVIHANHWRKYYCFCVSIIAPDKATMLKWIYYML